MMATIGLLLNKFPSPLGAITHTGTITRNVPEFFVNTAYSDEKMVIKEDDTLRRIVSKLGHRVQQMEKSVSRKENLETEAMDSDGNCGGKYCRFHEGE